MSLSIQTNVASLIAQNNIRVNSNFQSSTINRLSSGYRINSSADDAAGLGVANKYRGDTAELSQGVINANNGISSLQIIDGGLSNISSILDRLRTLATESASSTFTGNRTTVNNEYQGLLSEIDRQAGNIFLNTGGLYNTNLVTYIAGGSNQANAQVSVNLSGASSAVDATGLGISLTSVQGGGTELTGNSVRLDNTAATFLAAGHQDFTFNLTTATGNTQVAIRAGTDGAGLTGAQVISSLNSSLATYGISASIANDGTLQFSGTTAFSVKAGAASAGTAAATNTSVAINSSNYSLDSSTGAGGAFVAFTVGDTSSAIETVSFQYSGGTKTITLNDTNAGTLDQALSALNTALSGSGISAVKTANLLNISFQSSQSFNVNETVHTAAAGTGTGNLFGATGAQTIVAPAAGSSSTASAQSALTLLAAAVSSLGLVQGTVGGGQNKLQYAVNLAQSQITNYSAAQASLRDADVASEAANLTKAQVLQQASLAALAQANSAPQAVLSLLKG